VIILEAFGMLMMGDLMLGLPGGSRELIGDMIDVEVYKY